MRPNTLKATLKALIASGKNVHIEGSPGLGKTQLVHQAAQELGPKYHVVFKHGPTMQPEDLALPRSNGDRLSFARADWLPLTGDFDEGKHVVVFIDEMAQADASVQKSLANLMQEREAYGVALHDKLSFITTGNRASDRAGANRILSHLRNRMVTLKFEPSLDDWCQWALDNGVRMEIVSFLRFRPDQLNDFDPMRDLNPTPRMWAENVNDIVADVEQGVIPAEAEFECYEGCVGEGAATQFASFMKMYRKLPNPDAVLMQPDTYPVPEEASVRYALSGALAHRATEDNFDAVVTFAKRLPAEFAVYTLLDATRKNPALQNTKAFTNWAITDGSKVLM